MDVLSIKTHRAEPRVSSACTSWRTPVSRLDVRASAPSSCMLGDRSSKMIVVSAFPPAARPSQPPASGRLTAKIKAPIAAIRASMISHWRSRAYPRDIRLAASRNIIAPQRTV
jgi:hypothetical protein